MPSIRFPSLLLTAAFVSIPVFADLPLITDATAYNAWAYGDRPNQTYYSSSLISPRFLVNEWNKNASTSGSHIFMAPAIPGQKVSPMILSSEDLSLVYADPAWSGGTDTRMQIYDGTPYLTFWSGFDQKGHGTGGGVMVDSSYKEFKNLTTTGLITGADSHDFSMTRDGGAIMNNYHVIYTDLTSIGGPINGTLLDCAFQEVDVETGDVRFTWKATDHFNLTESLADEFYDIETGFDWFHMNAISKTVDGNYLISIRHLRAVALINGTDGSRIWQVGGARNSFKDVSGGNATNFAFQHDARFTDANETQITLFDNHAMHITSPTAGCAQDCTRAVRLALDYDAMEVRLVSEFYHPQGVQAWAQGGYHLLPNGNAVVGWGVVPAVTEFDEAGHVIMDIQIRPWNTTEAGGGPLYRVYKFDWVGEPHWQPTCAFVDGTVYVSWNGATKVASWSLFGGPSPLSMEHMTTVRKAGFETSILPSSDDVAFVRVDALDAGGNVIGSSNVVDTSSGDSVGSRIRA
ncbi:putative arylsulfotransferase-like protein [Rosellinia necatrix]|uniref:Putative arylsulfotransferase-like protein n=1 Tax=Rosellinia necatrix TaxID=77044 RepID=A0A1W2TXD7_ROSNE|nr:putative arylsulfotransferase-like protein [Rosellinia necatrix]